MTVPDKVAPGERVGPSIPGSDKTIANCKKRLRRIEDTLRNLLERSANKREISVDRVSLAIEIRATQELADYAQQLHSGFGAPFRGWATAQVSQINSIRDFEVESERIPGNRFHANIRLPVMVTISDGIRETCLRRLKERLCWEPSHSVVACGGEVCKQR